jgi:hypothetical protein
MWLGRILSSVRVLGHGAPGDSDAAFAENLDDFVIAQPRAAILVLYEVENGLFNTSVAQRFTGRGLIAGCEKVFHLENTLRRRHVFAGHSAAHRGLMHPHGIGNFSHGHCALDVTGHAQGNRAAAKRSAAQC